MLNPQSRQLLRDALRPPSGFVLDRAIVTTYSLDLIALLTVPLAFTVFEVKDDVGPFAADPLALLEALRRHASRLSVFCQAGQIHLPKTVQRLLGYLEGSVHECVSPKGGAFHPKLSVLRYVRSRTTEVDHDKHDVRYRLLCSSRNLTFDRSWDTMLVLGGRLAQTRQNAYARNRPLAQFVRSLPEMLLRPDDGIELSHIAGIADELLRVDFELPEGFEDMEFCPIGISGGSIWPMLGYHRTVTTAPFVDDTFVAKMTAEGGGHRLVSRHDALDQLSESTLAALKTAYYMNPAADSAEVEEIRASDTLQSPEASGQNDISDRSVPLEPSIQLTGLHAKLFIADDGWKAHVWTGSANATRAAFEKNVEFLVRLSGKKSLCGVDRFLEDEGGPESSSDPKGQPVRFADLLLRYGRTGPPVFDESLQRAEAALDAARTILIQAQLSAVVEHWPSDDQRYRLAVGRTNSATVEWPATVTVDCGLITLRDAFVPLDVPLEATVAEFGPITFEALTSFVAFRLHVRDGEQTLQSAFVLNVPTVGIPSDRNARLLLALLRNREQLLRYLLLLLADDEEAAARIAEMVNSEDGTKSAGAGGFGLPLFEPLMRALDRNPSSLVPIYRLIEDLCATANGRELISEEFLSIWQPIWAIAKNEGRTNV